MEIEADISDKNLSVYANRDEETVENLVWNLTKIVSTFEYQTLNTVEWEKQSHSSPCHNMLITF